MRSRPLIPGGRGGLLVLAIAAVPIVLNRCKPFAKKVGEKMVEWGEKIKRDADRTESPTAEDSSSKSDMKASTQDETLKSSSPAGKDEVKEQVAAATAPKKTPPKPKAATPGKKPAAKAKAGTTTNPKKPTKKPPTP